MNIGRSLIHTSLATLLLAGAVTTPPATAAGGPVTFDDIAAGDGAGITYRRTPSASEAIFDAIKLQPTYDFEDVLATPLKGRGAPGVAILDVDRDGDLDLYVTNGPGTPNSLYANQLQESGSLAFVDVAMAAGVDATAQDSTGTCFGDIDNDGDPDLMVLGNLEANRLYENLGDGTFADISGASGIGSAVATSTSCSMGDIDGDGLLDVVVANALDMSHQVGIFVEPFGFNQPNQLLRNQGGNLFADVTVGSGLLDIELPTAPPGVATVTWAIAMVDIDLDGDLDILHGDDQAGVPIGSAGGVDRGYIQLFLNDGTGQFTANTQASGLNQLGFWMGFSFGDFDHNGLLDVFGSSFGNHGAASISGSTDFSELNGDSRWFLQQADGTFADPSADGPLFTPFGWGTSAFDFDNDGDTDIVFHGGLDAGPFLTTNPGALLENDGSGQFTRNTSAFAGSTDHVRRTVHGVATADLDNDGFVDIVSVSNQNFPEPMPLTPAPNLGGEFQSDAAVFFTFNPLVPPPGFLFEWAGFALPNGTLSVERSSGNDNRWLSVETVGSVGITSGGTVNRDGIGAVVSVTPKNGAPVLLPVLGGSSYASQDSLRQTAGLGAKKRATVEVLWPGGVRNRLYNVRDSSRVQFPEIPCSIDTPAPFGQYLGCVATSLAELRVADVISHQQAIRLFSGAIRGYFDER